MNGSAPSKPVASRVAAVVVTRNRIDLLKQCIASLDSQTRHPDAIVVVDNASDDGTSEWLMSRDNLIVFRQGNLGGAGGFYRGIKESFLLGYDWFWIMDDDTIPDTDALERMLNAPVAQDDETGFLCSVVRWTDGSLHRMNFPVLPDNYPLILHSIPVPALPVLRASFVSCMIHRRAVEAVGLPLKEMFIWYDDSEFTRRVSERFTGYQILDSRVEHRSKSNYTVDFSDMSGLAIAYLKYGLRNSMFMARTSIPNGFPQIRYTLKTTLRLAWLVARQISGWDRVVLWRAIFAGIFFNPEIEFPVKRHR